MSRRMTRRAAAHLVAAPLLIRTAFGKASLTPIERVDRALAGRETDRPPISLWHHFGLEKDGPRRHAEQTLAFHKDYETDLVKVMSDFPFPKPSAEWWNVKEAATPFPAQLEALKMIRAGLNGKAHFVETIFNPWNVAEKLSSKEEVQRLKREKPERLLQTLETIARSEANHAKQAIAAGASGIFLAIANADESVLTREEYSRFSEPFDRQIFDAVRSAPLNVLHIHGSKVYLDRFETGWPGAVLNYSVKTSGVTLKQVRGKYSGVLAGGIDEVSYRSLNVSQLKEQSEAARREAGLRLILTPGCSVPNEAAPPELKRLREVFA